MTVASSWESYVPEFCVASPEMTADRVALVKSSWERIFAEGDREAQLQSFAESFYGKLFELAPAVRPLFKADIRGQASKLGLLLSTAVRILDEDVDGLVATLQALARRHHNYGVRPEHYCAVGLALVGALQTELGEKFEGEVQTSWVHLYSTIVSVMLPITVSMIDEEQKAKIVNEAVPVDT
ncbi:hypothetical protein NDN08_005557 [Rhodosorus marinus]|uniref:Globin domain-containing protein n=1 Tax=Rhodosorus marinus TaxID=101924 RepID=A0AAV8V1W9_9RHOD|nr:hypothetical protein NDN08_005557 [Rhodosorus marinus]